MKKFLHGFFALLMIGLAGTAVKEDSDKHAKHGFAVVELFTSEGCSSCPPADRLLGEMVARAHESSEPIYALAFHVDYWDYIGWKDPYAKKAYSDRQRQYARVFHSNRIYTPQMIINGEEEFVGSNRAKARKTIQAALKKPGSLEIFLKKHPGDRENQFKIEYRLSKLAKNAVLNLAVAERGLVQAVRRGENSGRTLQHENVVRFFKTVKLTKLTGELALEAPASVNLEKCSIIGYVQNEVSMEVLGASGIDL